MSCVKELDKQIFVRQMKQDTLTFTFLTHRKLYKKDYFKSITLPYVELEKIEICMHLFSCS